MSKEKSVKIFNNARLFELLFILFTISIVYENWNTTELKTLGINFVAIILEAFPFMLIGALIGGLIDSYLSKDWLVSFFNRKGKLVPILIAAAIGIIFPVCECAIVVVIRRLLKKGTPLGVAIAYLIAGPIFNPIVATSTLVAYSYNWIIPFFRLLCGFMIASLIGWIVNQFFDNKSLCSLDENSTHDCCHHHEGACNHSHDHQNIQNHFTKIKSALIAANEDFFQVGKYLVIGAYIAAISQSLVEQNDLVGLMTNPLISIVLMMLMAFLLNLCSESDAFIAAAFGNSGVPLSAQMAFMILGPMLDMKLILMYLGVFKKRFIILLVPLIIIMVLICVLILHFSGVLT